MSIIPFAQKLKEKVPKALAPIFPKTAAEKARDAQKASDKLFRQTQDDLMAAKLWTFGAFRHYQEKTLEAMGGTGFKGWLQKNQKNSTIEQTALKIKILSCMTPYELASNHKSVFTPESKRSLAQAAGVTPDSIEELLNEHDFNRADRRWYQIRQQFRRPLPRSPEEKEFLAKRDRHFSETENKFVEDGRAKKIEKLKQRGQYRPPHRRPDHQFEKNSEPNRAKSVRLPGVSPFSKF